MTSHDATLAAGVPSLCGSASSWVEGRGPLVGAGPIALVVASAGADCSPGQTHLRGEGRGDRISSASTPSQEEQNGANFSFIAPSNEEL